MAEGPRSDPDHRHRAVAAGDLAAQIAVTLGDGPAVLAALTGRGAPAGQDRSADITVELVAAMFPMTAIGPIRRFLPAVIALVAENIGHVKSVGQMTGTDTDPLTGRALAADGVATVLAGAGGGSATTTYAENIGVMAATKIYSTAVFLTAALIAVLLGFSPKFGAVIQTIPLPVMGGVSIVVFGLIAVAGAKIWVDNKVDFSQNKNLIVAAITLILGTGDFTLKFGDFALGGIGTATFGAIVLYALLNRDKS